MFWGGLGTECSRKLLDPSVGGKSVKVVKCWVGSRWITLVQMPCVEAVDSDVWAEAVEVSGRLVLACP